MDNQLTTATTKLREGGIVAFPTDTVFGLGSDAFNIGAIEKIFLLKGRPRGMPLPILVNSIDSVLDLAHPIPSLFWAIADRLWPGALTIVLPKSENVPQIVTSRGWKIGVRMPDHHVPLQLISSLGSPIIGTSANISGTPPALTASDVRSHFGDQLDFVIDEQPNPTGIASTLLDLTTSPPKIVRLGSVRAIDIEKACGSLIQSETFGQD